MRSAKTRPSYEKLVLAPGELLYTLHRTKDAGAPAQPRNSHFHDMLEFICFDRAGGEVDIEGRIYPLAPRTVVYVPALCRHDFYIRDRDELDLHLLQVETALLAALRWESRPVIPEAPFVGQLAEDDYGRLRSLMAWLDQIRLRGGKRPLRDDILRLILRAIEELAGARRGGEVGPTGKGPETFRPLLGILEKDAQAQPRLDQAARLCGLSRFYFCRVFRRFFHMGYKEYLLRRRLSKAMALLAESQRSVTEIALDCGFADTAHFCRTFRRELGLRPLDLRKAAFQLDRRSVRPAPEA